MIRTILISFLIILLHSSVSAQLMLEQAFPNLSFDEALDLEHAGDYSDRIFIVERDGRIKVFPNDASVTSSSVKVFLDITDRVSAGGEMGLLGLAFHPDYENNGYFYVNYTVSNPRKTRISRFNVSQSNPDSAVKTTELILLDFSQPFSNHNGGKVAFGPDGYLYIATGDGGSGGDPQNNAQTITNLLGKILRIDVDNQDTGLNYAIPLTNPFYDSTGAVTKEIYAWGLRNPWRFSFDFTTGWLWCGDVGQNNWEEVDVIENGKNYGWRCYEGFHPYNLSGCNGTYTDPIHEYSHSEGFSITGGYVYRGPNVSEIFGKYIYGDYGTRKIWSIEYDGINPAVNEFLLTAPGSITSFGEDQNKELYVVSFNGKVYRFTPTANIIAPSGLAGDAGFTLRNPPEVVVDLYWKDNSDNETNFILERKLKGESYQVIQTLPANSTSYSDIGLIEDTIYSYRVKAVNGSDTSSYSNEFTVHTPVLQLAAPSDLVATALNPFEVELNWTDNSLDEDGFKIERKLGFNGNYELIDSVTTNIHQYNDTSVDDNTLYVYRVYAFSQIGFSPYSNEDSVMTPLATSLDDTQSIVDDYRLEQNYPNPFNPTTLIRYAIPEQSEVELEVYNVLGIKVDDLIKSVKSQGVHEVQWDAKDLSSGIYYLKMKGKSLESSKNFVKVIKMILVK